MKKRIVNNLRRKLRRKESRLTELEQQFKAATLPASRSSFKGKITRCRKDIAGLKARIQRLEQE